MENIRKNKFTITVGLLIIAALLAVTVFSMFDFTTSQTSAAGINSNAKQSVIGDHGVGEVEHLSEGAEQAVRQRFSVGSDYSVVWVYSASELKQHLETASGAKADAGKNKIIVLGQNIDWEQSNINEDVGSQKFVGILDGNGYNLNITFSSTVKGGGSAKSGNESYYKVTQSDIGESSNNFSGTDGNAVRGVGLVVGVNAGTIANLTVNYNAAEGAMRDGGTVDSNGKIEDTNSLDSAQDPDVPYAYGIVTGINIGTIRNVYVDQQAIFNGNTKARTSFNGSSHADPAEAHENCAAVGGIAGINMGYGVINNCYMYVGGAIWAQADGSNSNGADSAARYATTFAGGIVGWIKGDNSQLTYCYLDGNGDICSWAQRGKNLTLGGQNEPWSISYAGGVTAGKIQIYRESNYTMGVERRNCYSVAQPMGANQVKGIISNWTGYRRDSYGSTSYVDVTNTYSAAARARRGMPFDFLYSADQGSDKQDLVIFTFNYKDVTGNETLDLDHYANDGEGTTNPAKMKSNWIEVYLWEHSLYPGGSEVSVTFEDNYLRIQAKSKNFMEGQDVQLESITRSTNANGYQPKYDSNFMGCMIWGADIYSIGADVSPESSVSSTVYKPTDQLGSFVQYYPSTMSKGSYVVKFGATYDYTLTSAIATSRQYNGNAVDDMMPTLKLTDANGNVTVNDSYYTWKFSGASAGEISKDLTLYPDTYYIYPYAIIDEQENENYAYFDSSQRTLAVNKGIRSTVIVSRATLSLNYNNSDWVNQATIPVTLTSNNAKPTSQIIDAYSYQGGTNNNITELPQNGTNDFNIIETATTPQNGRTIYGVTAYVKTDDGYYIAVADTMRADIDKQDALIKIDNATPVLSEEKYYLADQFEQGASVEDIYNAIKSNPDAYTELDSKEVLEGRWYNKEIIAVVSLSDENRSGVTSVGVEEAVKGSNFGNMDQSRYTMVSESGNATVIIRIVTESSIRLRAGDAKSNNGTIELNEGNFVNIDTVPIEVQETDTTYIYRNGKSVYELQIDFKSTFGSSGLYVWYYIDENTTLGDDVTVPPDDKKWVRYEFGVSVVSGSKLTILIPESMDNAAVFLKFTSGVDGYDVATPVVMRVTALADGVTHNKFTIDLSDAKIQFNAQYIMVRDKSAGTTYNLSDLVNNVYQNVNLTDFFSKSYDGTAVLNPNIEFYFDIADDQPLTKFDHYNGEFTASSEEGNFRVTWLKFDVYYTRTNAGDCYLNIGLAPSDTCPLEMKVSVDFGGEAGVQQSFQQATYISKLNMAFDIGQIFSEGQNIEMSAGSYTIGGDGKVQFNWIYGDVFDGLEVRIVNDKTGGDMYFRFKCDNVGGGYMNVGGKYSAYVDAIKINSPVYEMEDYAELTKVGDVYVGDAGENYTVSISGVVDINVQQKEVRLTFELDGKTDYNFSIPYDMGTHVMKAYYKDVDGNLQYAKITWKKSNGAELSPEYQGISEIGSYTAVAKIEDGNYAIKGQYQQVITIESTYLEVFVPDKEVQYNDGKAVTYIPELPEGSPAEGEDIAFTIIYYQKLGNSLKLLGENAVITEVGEYYVSVTFDPDKQPEGSPLRQFARKEYTKAENGTVSLDDTSEYIVFNVVKANTVIGGVKDQTKTYNSALQIIEYKDAVVNSELSKQKLEGVSPVLQYWDDAAQAYVNFDGSNNGKFKDAGSYKYKLVYDGNENYNGCELEITMTINPATITGVVFGSQEIESGVFGVSAVYDGKEHYVAADISGSNVNGEEGIEIGYRKMAVGQYSSDVPKYVVAGKYTVYLQITGGNNFITYETTAVVYIKRAPYPGDVLIFDSANEGGTLTVEYDGKAHEVAYTINEKYEGEADASPSLKPQTDAGEYAGSITVTMSNYEGFVQDTLLIIKPRTVDKVDTSKISEILETEGLTSTTDLNELEVTFEGINGTVKAEIMFWDENGDLAIPDAWGCLPAGKYKVTYDAGPNYDLSDISGNLELAEGEHTKHVDLDGDNKCDICGEDMTVEHAHVDANGDGKCDVCGEDMKEDPVDPNDHEHVDANGDGKCDVCGGSMGNVTPPQEAPDVVKYVVLAVCGVLIVVSVAGVIIAAVVKSKKKKNNRYNII